MDLQRRYDGRPFVRLLDAYVLWSIGMPPPEQDALFQQMTLKLRQIWNRQGERWYEVVAIEMNFPMPASIRAIWNKNQAIADANNTTLKPPDFAYMFVDPNFVPSV